MWARALGGLDREQDCCGWAHRLTAPGARAQLTASGFGADGLAAVLDDPEVGAAAATAVGCAATTVRSAGIDRWYRRVAVTDTYHGRISL